MRLFIYRIAFIGCGTLLLMIGLLMSTLSVVSSAPQLVITETATGEPPTLTPTTPPPTATATGVPPTIEPPTATAVPPSVTPPTGTTTVPATPTAIPPGEPGAPRNTPTPSAIPELGLTATPITSSDVADPAIEKTVDRSSVALGDLITFTLSVTNRGNATASDVVVEDSLPSFLSLEGASASRGEVTTSGARTRVVIGSLAPGELVTVTITARVIALPAAPNNLNVGTLTTSSPSDDPNNNRSSVELNERPLPPASLPNTGSSATGAGALILFGILLIAIGSLYRRSA